MNTTGVSLFPLNVTNYTTAAIPRVTWPFDSIMTLTCSILMAILNSSLAAVFLAKSEIRSSFTTYLTALLIFNSLVSIHGFLNVIKSRYPVHMRNPRLCDFRLYVSWVITGIPLNLHVLITINRIWAITFPVSYRNKHSPRVAWTLVVLVVFYVHAVCLPGVLLDALHYRFPVEKGCSINSLALPRWNQMAMLLIYEFPIVFIGVSWVYLLLKQRKQRSTIGNLTRIATVVDDASGHNNSGTILRPRRQRFSKGFLVFSTLTVSAVLCWTPYETYYVIWAFVDLSETDRRFIMLFLGLYLIQPVLDPVLIVLTMPDLRWAVRHMLKKFPFCFSTG